MESTALDIAFEDLDEVTFAFQRLDIEKRGEVLERVQELAKVLGERTQGPAIVTVEFGAVKDRLRVQVGYPVAVAVDIEGVETRTLEPIQVMTATHEGSYDDIRATYLLMYAEMRKLGIIPAPVARELLLEMDGDDPDKGTFQVQWPLHDWTGLLAEGVEEVMGTEARDKVMEGADDLTPDTPREVRLEWVKAALGRLDDIADEEQKFWAVSKCADCYPPWRIQELRGAYLRNHDVDEAMDAMKGDTEWYSTPYREGNLVYHTKVPFDREAWEKATDRDERRRAYCHCALVQDRIDEVPPTYCYCGTGWVKQVWEGILDRPVRVEVLKSLPAGDDECQFLIHLPEDVVG